MVNAFPPCSLARPLSTVHRGADVHPLNHFTVLAIIGVLGIAFLVDWRALWRQWKADRRQTMYVTRELYRISHHDD